VLMLVVPLLHLHYPAAVYAFVPQSAACGGLLHVFLFRS
jgi:hypothetical protein